MASPTSFDVMVLGAGPAGSVLAQQLQHKGYCVALMDRERFPRYTIGETLPASVALLLKRAGLVPPNFRLAGAPTSGNLSAWGSANVSFHPHTKDESGRGFQVERAHFDAQLLAAARAAGGTALEGWRPQEFNHKNGWRITLRATDGSTRRVRAKFVCDASGRARVLARRLRLPLTMRDRQLGLIGYWQTTQADDTGDGFNALVESLPNGWFYTAALSTQRRVAGFMTDRTLLPANVRRNASQIYLRALERTRHVKRRLRQFTWDNNLRIFPTYPSLVERCCGPDWLLVGDAASTLDPLCSQGVQKAIASALTSATAVHTLLVHPERRESVIEFCDERERIGFLSHLAARASYYRREQRFKGKPFWKQRTASAIASDSIQVVSRPPIELRSQDHVAAGSTVRLLDRPVIEGEFVEVKPTVVSSHAERGVRYCGDIRVPDLMNLMSDNPTFETLFLRYQNLHRDISAASFSQGIAGLFQLQLVQRAG
jgi:flavin-dependent dehydrogenase